MAIQYTTAGQSTIPAWMEATNRQLLDSVGGKYDQEGNLLEPGLVDQEYLTYNEANPNRPRVVNQDNMQIDAYNAVKNVDPEKGIGGYKPYLTNAGINITDATGVFDESNARNQVTTGTGTGIGTLAQYFNPYQQHVIDATMNEMNRQHTMDLNTMNANAAKASAYGGSRHGVLEAEMNRNHEQNRMNMLAQLNAQGFDVASNMNKDYLNRNLTGAQTSNQIDATEAQTNIDAARVNNTLAGQAQTLGTNDVNLQAHYGDRAQTYNQSVRDSAVQDYYEKEMRPFQVAGFYSDILQGVPSNQSTLTTQTAPEPSSLSQGIGALGTYAAIGNQFGWWGDSK